MQPNKRSDLRRYYQDEAAKTQSDIIHQQRTNQLDSIEGTIIDAFNALLKFIDGNVTKAEIVNQLSVLTPDVDKVVNSLSKLDANILKGIDNAKIDLKPVIEALNGLKREITLIPAKIPKPIAQKDTIKVSNLSEVKLDTSAVEKAIKALDLKVDVKAPIINTEKVDLKPLKDIMLGLLKAFNSQKPAESIKVSNLKDIIPTDTKKIESKLDDSNKYLKKILDKPTGGGGGGGNGSPYTDSNGIIKNVILNTDGSIPVSNNQSPTAGNNPSFDADIVFTTNAISITNTKTIGTDNYQHTRTIDRTDPTNLHITGSEWIKI